MYFSSRNYQKSYFASGFVEISGGVDDAVNGIEEYSNLSEINENLARENAILRSAQRESYFPLFSVVDTVVDTLYAQQYVYVPGKVISASYKKTNNYLTVNLGRVHGVKPQQGVASADGVVGVVKEVSEHYSRIIPLIHPKFTMSGSVKGSPYFGTLVWDGKSYEQISLLDIPRHAQLEEGDTIVTNQKSSLFPPGITIGYVREKTINPNDGFYSVTLDLAHDFATMGPVYTIENLLAEEQQNLEADEE
ncbi:MAG: rod shape-determining protein MreC [Schleiferiaceae bacterium]